MTFPHFAASGNMLNFIKNLYEVYMHSFDSIPFSSKFPSNYVTLTENGIWMGILSEKVTVK